MTVMRVGTCQFPVSADIRSNARHIARQLRVAEQRGRTWPTSRKARCPGTPGSTSAASTAERHNDLGIADPVTPVVADFDVNINGAIRPYPVLNSGDFVTATTRSITDPALRSLIPVGAIDQLTHADDALINFSGWPRALAGSYRSMLRGSAE
ncbi:hypothetical protein SAMN05421805_108108 [Saccharopolyspora antimicrobica]|uniref:Uncharacterized protein n=1 Tax=Saccharopolyspora antimicrobica TaxID=455193 RepID=A0A1I5DER4_9PSEU|nr:hypothetical protein [Saccharopolyspora antimicrobica]SFN97607.1 hypothetical protein SAMN05421805_108108 [Saccharopolyspora antimicrobica]